MVLSTRLAIGALLLPLFFVLDRYIHTQYIFDPALLQQISQRAIQAHGNDTLPMLEQITRDLKTEYGDAIVDWSREDWFFNNAGGAMVGGCFPQVLRPVSSITGVSPGNHGHLTRVHQRVSHLLRHRLADRRPFRRPSGGRLFHHPRWRGARCRPR